MGVCVCVCACVCLSLCVYGYWGVYGCKGMHVSWDLMVGKKEHPETGSISLSFPQWELRAWMRGVMKDQDEIKDAPQECHGSLSIPPEPLSARGRNIRGMDGKPFNMNDFSPSFPSVPSSIPIHDEDHGDTYGVVHVAINNLSFPCR